VHDSGLNNYGRITIVVSYLFDLSVLNSCMLINLQEVTSTLDDDERVRQNYILRPLQADLMAKHNIEPPLLPILDCSSCKSGLVYRSAHDAIAHLQHIHFKYESSLSELVHPPRLRRWFVRTENDLKNELANRHQLDLLRLCLTCVTILVTRAEKIHAGIALAGERDNTRYQLPNDLVDCFEATALFLMQSATSVLAMQDEMRKWQYTPGTSIEKIKTPTVKYLDDGLGEMGQFAQAAMTSAEKTLALADSDTNHVRMGAASPELLVAVLLQDVLRRQLLDGVSLDANQLYQEYTSKLVRDGVLPAVVTEEETIHSMYVVPVYY
jgi:hypothetical protein